MPQDLYIMGKQSQSLTGRVGLFYVTNGGKTPLLDMWHKLLMFPKTKHCSLLDTGWFCLTVTYISACGSDWVVNAQATLVATVASVALVTVVAMHYGYVGNTQTTLMSVVPLHMPNVKFWCAHAYTSQNLYVMCIY
jgi:hypothetical protein